MKKLITVALSLLFAVGLSGFAVAGSLDSPGAPSAGSGMYTLQNLYDYLTSGAALTVQSSFQEPMSGPGSTMKTTKEIGDGVQALFTQCPATAADVKSGVKFFSTKPGSWGVQTGTLVVPPTPTPTITPTPTPETVMIGSLEVAAWVEGPGCANNVAMTWADAVSYVTDLVWLTKSDWRLPTQAELSTICTNKAKLGSYQAYRYWTSTQVDANHMDDVIFPACSVNSCNKTFVCYLLAVRP